MKENNIARLSMLASATLMGSIGLYVTALRTYNTFTIVLLRGIFGTLFLSILMLKTKSFSRSFLKTSFKSHWKYLIIIAITNPIVIYLYFININLSGYSIAAFLLYTHGLFVLLLLLVAKLEKVKKFTILSFILSILGVAIIMEFWKGFSLSWNAIIGILSGLILAILIFSKKKIYLDRNKTNENEKLQGNFDLFLAWWPTLFIIILFLPISIGELFNLSFFDLIIAILMGLFPTALAFTLYNIGVKRDKSGNIVIISYIEPLIATIMNVIFLGAISIFILFGGILILISNFIVIKYSS